MATITSNGPSPIPKLKDLVDLTLDIKNNNSTTDLVRLTEELIEAIKEITNR